MISEFSAHPRPTNRRAHVLAGVFLLLTVAGVVAYFVVDRYRGLIGFAAVACFTATAMLYVHYIAARYTYTVTRDSSGIPVFVVTQRVGKRESTLCRIALYEIVRIEREERGKRHSAPRGTHIYSYLPTLSPSVIYRVYQKNAYENAEILLECTPDFAALLLSYVGEAKTDRGEFWGEE